MNFAFRVDASIQIGTGHVMRCLTLAHALKPKCNDIYFICRKLEGNLIDLIKEQGFKVLTLTTHEINQNTESCNDVSHSHWLCVPWEKDAEESIEQIENLGIELLIIDHYAIDYSWEEKLRPFSQSLMVIDDLADRKHDCDILLDQNLWPDMNNRYKSQLINSNTISLLGPEYALLRPEYLHIPEKQHNSDKKRVLAFFGGIDATGECKKLFEAFSEGKFNNLELNIITGKNNRDFEELYCSTRKIPNISVSKFSDHFIQEIADSDFFIGASGSTNWERFCIGCHTFVASTAENQRQLSQHLSNLKLVSYLGHFDEITSKDYIEVLSFCNNSNPNPIVIEKQRKLVDGKGTQRVVQIIKQLLEKQEEIT